MSTVLAPERKAPWHVSVVAVVALLWNGAGAYTIIMAQAGRLYVRTGREIAYYAAQPLWFVVLTDIALAAAIAAALSLLWRKRMAVWLFALSWPRLSSPTAMSSQRRRRARS